MLTELAMPEPATRTRIDPTRLPPAPHQVHRKRYRSPKTGSSPMARVPRLDIGNNTLTQIVRQRMRHGKSPPQTLNHLEPRLGQAACAAMNGAEFPMFVKFSTFAKHAALDHIGVLIDASNDARFARGADRAIYLLEELEKRDLDARHGAILEYFRANAWSWAWEHPEREQQILALSRAVTHPGFVELDVMRRCQILTNRAN
ncbi:hypothetical protein V4R08_12025 [Nitrobacter sp. NHB1]|uniref:hypothetical protein n=1 Tax=Nitrobacter sp. NHB1 TaxID=3119830 RepID=UPI002FFE67CF